MRIGAVLTYLDPGVSGLVGFAYGGGDAREVSQVQCYTVDGRQYSQATEGKRIVAR